MTKDAVQRSRWTFYEVVNFEKTGYWVRVGSSLLHLGLIIFRLDIFFYRYRSLHIILFWFTKASTTVGMVFCFFAGSFSRLVNKTRNAIWKA